MTVLLIEDGYFYTRKGDNNYSISMTIFGYNVITLNIPLFYCKNHRCGHWRCSVKDAVDKKTPPISKENTCIGAPF